MEYWLLRLTGIKSTCVSLIITFGIISLLIYFPTQWQNKLTQINYLVYPLLVITALFAAQFNKSRIAILCFFWLLYLYSIDYPARWSAWLVHNPDWVLLFGASLLLLLAVIKDRALFSVHIIIRCIFIAVFASGSFIWLNLNQSADYFAMYAFFPQQLSPYLPLTLPLSLIALLLVWLSIKNHNLTLIALLVTFLLWCLNQQKIINLPWSIVAATMSSIYFIAVSIESYYLAYRDELTSLPTRRALNQLALSLGRKYTVAMLDIDHFKKFNDTYGHDIGDQVLKLVAVKMSGIKGGGKIYRYGGEEFTIVFPRKTIEQSIHELETLRHNIATYDMVIRNPKRTDKKSRKAKQVSDNKTVNVTISIGVAQRAAKQSFDEALKNADLALYRAKKKGRNNVSE